VRERLFASGAPGEKATKTFCPEKKEGGRSDRVRSKRVIWERPTLPGAKCEKKGILALYARKKENLILTTKRRPETY